MYGWRGTIGLVKPTFRAGPLEAFIRFMPDGVCVVPRYIGIRAGTEKEFEDTLAIADQRVSGAERKLRRTNYETHLFHASRRSGFEF